MFNQRDELYNKHHEIDKIAGDEYDIPFIVTSQNNEPCSLWEQGVKIEWRLSPYGGKSIPLLSKDIVSGGITLDAQIPNRCLVHIYNSDTDDLDGLFVSQLTITDPKGRLHRCYEGRVIIRSRIPKL